MYLQFIKNSRKTGLVKPSTSQEYESKQGNDTRYGLCFWNGREDKNEAKSKSTKNPMTEKKTEEE
jgi:hypothetical protein